MQQAKARCEDDVWLALQALNPMSNYAECVVSEICAACQQLTGAWAAHVQLQLCWLSSTNTGVLWSHWHNCFWQNQLAQPMPQTWKPNRRLVKPTPGGYPSKAGCKLAGGRESHLYSQECQELSSVGCGSR